VRGSAAAALRLGNVDPAYLALGPHWTICMKVVAMS
jgi:hypothetical protein